jgi:succinate dehydrogenase/fumarate reductase flavoprotein subunit
MAALQEAIDELAKRAKEIARFVGLWRSNRTPDGKVVKQTYGHGKVPRDLHYALHPTDEQHPRGYQRIRLAHGIYANVRAGYGEGARAARARRGGRGPFGGA